MESVNKNQGLKVLWNSNAPFAPTGYGTVSSNVCYPLLYEGFDVRVAANYGLESATLGFRNFEREQRYTAATGKQPVNTSLSIYPRLWTEWIDEVLDMVIKAWKPDVFVTLYDIWVGGLPSKVTGKPNWFHDLHPRWVAWFPVDTDPIGKPILDKARLAYKRVAMSRFGQDQLKKNGLDSTLIPHGVETSVFKPLDRKASRVWRQSHTAPLCLEAPAKIEEGSFVVGINASNKDPYRKDFERMTKAFKIFLEQNPDARKESVLDFHTWMEFPGGFDQEALCKQQGIERYVKHTFPYYMLCSLSAADLARTYSSWDVYLNLCRGGGFEIGHIESASCGVPSIGVDFTSMPELIRDHGWLVPLFAQDVECPHCKERFSYHGGATQVSHLLSSYGIPDEYRTADALEDAYNHPEKRAAFGKASREFALGYDYDTKILPLWVDLLSEVQSELGMFGTAAKKDDAFEALYAKAVGGA